MITAEKCLVLFVWLPGSYALCRNSTVSWGADWSRCAKPNSQRNITGC